MKGQHRRPFQDIAPRKSVWRALRDGELSGYEALIGSVVAQAVEDARRGDKAALEDLRALGMASELEAMKN